MQRIPGLTLTTRGESVAFELSSKPPVRRRTTQTRKAPSRSIVSNANAKALKALGIETEDPSVFGSQTIYGKWSQIKPFVDEMGLSELPQTLISQMQNLPANYKTMSIQDIVMYASIKGINLLILAKDEEELRRGYLNIGRLIKSCRRFVLSRECVETMQQLIDLLAPSGDPQFIAALHHIKGHLQILLGDQGTISFSEKLKIAWQLSAVYYHIEALMMAHDKSTLSDLDSQTRLYACLLPIMANDLGVMLRWFTGKNREALEKCQRHFREFFEQFLKENEKFVLHIGSEELQQLHPEEVVLLLPYLDQLKSTERLPNLKGFPQEVQQVFEKLMVKQPQNTCDLDRVTEFIGSFFTHFEKLEAIYEVDVVDYLRLFSESRGARLFARGSDTEVGMLIESRGRELELLCEGLGRLATKITEAVILSNNAADMFVLFTLWFYGLGQDNSLPENQLNDFNAYRNDLYTKARVTQKNLLHWRDSMRLGLSEDNFSEEVLTSWKALEEAVDDFIDLNVALNWHARAISVHASGFQEIRSKRQEKYAAKEAELAQSRAKWHAAEEALLRDFAPKARRKTRKGQIKRVNAAKTAKRARDLVDRQLVRSEVSSSLASSSSEIVSTQQIQPAIASSSIGPVETLLTHLLNAFEGASFHNIFAQQSWRSATEQYKDLMAEIIAHRDLSEPAQAAEHVNRIVVLLSLMMEQILSAYLLEDRNPKDIYERWTLLRHDSLGLLAGSKLAERVVGLEIGLQAVADLEIFSRSLYTSPYKDSVGARLLYAAETLRLSRDPEAVERVVQDCYALIRSQLLLVNQLISQQDEQAFNCLNGVAAVVPQQGGVSDKEKLLLTFIQRAQEPLAAFGEMPPIGMPQMDNL